MGEVTKFKLENRVCNTMSKREIWNEWVRL